MTDVNKSWRFCVVGNIVKMHEDANGNVFYGTKAFVGGTKVYTNDETLGLNYSKITVIGCNRFKRYVVERIPIDNIENIRLQRVYKPQILEIMDYLECIDGIYWRERTAKDRRTLEAFVEELNK